MRNAERTMRSRRGGASILEVLFAILVTTIGLLGAVAVFPVAGSYARKARLADMMAAGGRSAVHAFDTRGMRRAEERWIVANNVATPAYVFVRSNAAFSNPAFSYCIDSRFVAANNTTPATRTAARTFPYSATAAEPQMLRITLWNGLSGAASGPMDQLQSDLIFSVDDDLTFIRPGVDKTDTWNLPISIPNDNTLPGIQLFSDISTGSGNQWGKRQAGGEFSWLATLVPKADLHSLASGGFNDLYVLSIVMFHQRPMVDLALDTPGTSELYERSERVLGAWFVDAASAPIGDGVGGGTVRLTKTLAAPNLDAAKKYLNVRPGDWILLAGQERVPPVTGTLVNRFHWYRVSSCDSEPTDLGGGNYELYVSLIGGDWNVNLTNQRAIILDGVIGVYEKTIRLETGGAM